MPDSLQIALKNDSASDRLFVFVTGLAIQHGNQRCLLKADGHELYFPSDPPAIGSPLAEDCAIPLGPPGNTKTITIPQIAGGRIWVSEERLTFLLNPGSALVEPSVLNPSDPNANINFGFCEFTLNDAQLYANITYVDFVSRIPIAITLQQNSGEFQHVAGMAPDGLDRMAADLSAQASRDQRPWDKLIVSRDGRILRILNATHGNAVGADFNGYYEPYVADVWDKYSRGAGVDIDTQAGPGTLSGRIHPGNGQLVIGEEGFSKPSTADIFGCNSGPFTTGPSPTRNAIIPRLAAAFVRSTLLITAVQPSAPDTYYRQDPTNHYARLVHTHNLDGKGYAFAYDDVQRDGDPDQSGKVNAGDPVLFTVTVGGQSASRRLNGAAISRTPSTFPADGAGPPPPIPPHPFARESGDREGGLRGKLKGFAQKILH